MVTTPPPDLPAGTPWWVGAGIAVVGSVGGLVLAILGLVLPRRGTATPPTDSGEPERSRHAQPLRAGTDEVLAMAERQWDRERARYEEERDELKTEIRALHTRVGQLEQEAQWMKLMLERFAPPPRP